MRRALELAERGRGFAHPNPLVGAVLVHRDRIVAEGWHAACGLAHAEPVAIAAAREAGFTGWREATLYVTLEPCCHTGRTPPCTDALLEAGIGHVVYALDDPDPRVAGGGRARLEAGGVRVESGLLKEHAGRQNEAYLHHRRTGLPFAAWKTVRTPDGETSWTPGTRTAVSGPETDAWVDELRARHDAVLIGGRTARIDDPGLRVRCRARTPGTGEPAFPASPDPWRIVLTESGNIPASSRLLTENADRRTLLCTRRNSVAATEAATGGRAEVIEVADVNGRIDLRDAFARLAGRGLLSILVEAGDGLGRALLAAGLLQRLLIVEAPREAAPAGWTPAPGTPAHADLLKQAGTRHESALGRDRRVIIELGAA